MACFGRKKKVDKGPTYDFSVPTPQLPDEPSQFVVIGPTGSGKRTLASQFAYLTLPFSSFPFEKAVIDKIRLHAQYTGVIRMVNALDSKKKKKKLDEETMNLVQALKSDLSEVGLAGLTKSEKKRTLFLNNAKTLAANPQVQKRVSEFYAKSNDLALLHYSKPRPELYEEDYQPVYEDELYSGTTDGPDLLETQDMMLSYHDYPVHMIVYSGEQWETANLPDSPFEGPYSVVIVVPLDEYIRDNSRDAIPRDETDPVIAEEEKKLEQMLADAKNSKDEEKKEEKKEDAALVDGEDGETKKKRKKKKKEKKEDDEELIEGDDSETKEEAKKKKKEEKTDDDGELIEGDVSNKKEEKKKRKKKGEDDGDEGDKKKEEKTKQSKLLESSAPAKTSSSSVVSSSRLSASSLRGSSEPVRKGYRNKLTASLEVIEKLRNSQTTLLRKADSVVLLFSHYDLFEKIKPEDGSIKNSFPDFSMEENPKNVLNYITDVFEDALHVVCPSKVRSTSGCFIDADDIRRTVLPHFFDIVETTIRLHEKRIFSAKTDAMVNRAQELCGDKPIPIPFNAETMRLTIESGEISDIGKRKNNEDALVVIDEYKSDTSRFSGRVSFYAVYDGHGGSFVSNNCAKCVHKMVLEHPAFPYDANLAYLDAFRKVDKVVTAPEDKSGSTGLCCAIYNTCLYLGNVGDSECVLGSREAQKGRFRTTLLSKKHNPTDPDEKKRISDMGGSVVFGRLFGTLAVSRGFGDMTYKQPGKEYVSVEPHVEVRALDRTCHFLILGCDGLWDTVSYELAVKTVGEVFDRGEAPNVAAKALCDLTQSRGSQDNVSVIVVYFRWSKK